MSQVFRLPDLGEGLTEAEVVEWSVSVGDEVVVDQEVVTVETAKAAVAVPCPYAGTVTAVHAQAGEVLPVGEPLITIGGTEGGTEPGAGASGAAGGAAGAGGEQYRTEERAGTASPADGEEQPERPLIGYGAGETPARRRHGARRHTPSATSPTVPTQAQTSTRPSVARGGQAPRVISPLVRQLAKEYAVDLAAVRPGPTGVIRRADLEAYRQQTQHRPDPTHPTSPTPDAEKRERRIPIQGVRRIMVERLTTSRREIPDATTWVDVDATRLMKVKDQLRTTHPDAGIGVLPLLARMVVAGLGAYPALNSSVDTDAGEIVHHGAVNLGFAAQSPRGLVVPVVRGADAMTTTELAAALRELTTAAREGRLTPTDLTGGTFTLNNYGVFGVDGSTPIINHPEAAMLGVGRIVDKPWAHRGKVRVRKVTQLSFTFDHRVCDGGVAGGFLRHVADLVEHPAGLLADV
ncbi:dihydrolipoamide acetyltransferase family protein [Serinicoccus sp. LYQ131]|uniref:dihydrolipoamide acetyltransferase family protein n=1 Tax=Serinicoccus sp. LYQ131 TaxID=3378797 RepID=UPI00385337EE